MEKRFRALRTIATIYKILACVILILGVLFALVLFSSFLLGSATMAQRDLPTFMLTGGVAAVFGATFTLVYAVVLFLILYGAGEGIYLALAIEENTRESSQLLRTLQR
jgi:presenilin-like A22 family membrane protease